MIRRIILAAARQCVGVAAIGVLCASLKADELPVVNSGPPTAAPSASASFEALLPEWNGLFAALQAVVYESMSSEAGNSGIDYKATISQLQDQIALLRPRFLEAASSAWKEQTSSSSEARRQLLGAFHIDTTSNRYADAVEWATVLLSHPSELSPDDRIELLRWGAISASNVNEFQCAKEWLGQLAKIEPLSIGDERRLPQIEKVLPWWTDEQRLWKRDEAAADLPVVRIRTTAGEVVLQLYIHDAPRAVETFVSLVESGYYDGRQFEEMGLGQGAILGEIGSNGESSPSAGAQRREGARKRFRGSVGVSVDDTNERGCRIYVDFVPQPDENSQYSVIGRVAKGLESLERSIRDVGLGRGSETLRVISATADKKSVDGLKK